MTENMKGREILFEYQQIGNIMRVTAMDVATLTEVIVQAPIGGGETVWQRQALARLEYVLKKAGIIKG